jgi:hypothetical protein
MSSLSTIEKYLWIAALVMAMIAISFTVISGPSAPVYMPVALFLLALGVPGAILCGALRVLIPRFRQLSFSRHSALAFVCGCCFSVPATFLIWRLTSNGPTIQSWQGSDAILAVNWIPTTSGWRVLIRSAFIEGIASLAISAAALRFWHVVRSNLRWSGP